MDRRRSVEVEGVVLRRDVWQEALDLGKGEVSKSLHHLVIDDGIAAELTAWVVPDPLAERCRIGRSVRLTAQAVDASRVNRRSRPKRDLVEFYRLECCITE